MNSLTIFLLVGCVLGAYGLPSRIVGGNDAAPGKYPYQVSLRKWGSHFCGGSIISQHYVLTAAHCVVSIYDKSAVTVHAGTNLLKESGDVYRVEKIVYHKQYNSGRLTNDIAVLRVKGTIKFTDRVQPVAPATKDFEEGHECVVSGWGTTATGGMVPDKLQELKLLIESQTKCSKQHWQVQNSHICTFVRVGQGLCHGDSGGPLVAGGTQIGIVSFGRPCAVGYPDVFTRVSYFQDWLKEQVKD